MIHRYLDLGTGINDGHIPFNHSVGLRQAGLTNFNLFTVGFGR
jgi:hypothetical protein